MKKFRILLDLDEVLADFVGGCCRIHGVSREELERHWPPGQWSIVEPLGKALAEKGKLAEDYDWNEDDFWLEINYYSPQFWSTLEPTPWAKELVKLVESFTKDWHIVSAPSRSPESYTGKVRWLKAFFGQRFDRFALTPHKEIFACHNVVLIDDREENTRKFAEAGGWGVPFPSRHNSKHEKAANALEEVKSVLESILT